MKIEQIKNNAFSMPITTPSAPLIDYKFKDREYLIISYETDIELLKEVVPEPLKVISNVVHFEFMKMPDSAGFGSFKESGQVIEVEYNGRKGLYSHLMFVDDVASIVAGREVWGFPKKYGFPSLDVDVDTLTGRLKYNQTEVAIGTMGYKYYEGDIAATKSALETTPNYILKVIPSVTGKGTDVCQLIEYYMADVNVKGVWTGPAALQLFEHALAPVAQLPIKKVIGGKHQIVDFTLSYGNVLFDYLK
ncbi:acetoacetate decarboxylase [Photobacterium angustum]|uniref:acetoacetate decarboxylase n=1 Tax=Photobacterium angustum TaxID=661 RepID=UPI0005DF13B5|nr:acetoacetate decarboxylase [Photobacterium angustum]KJF93675.1 acetoacetate decarboxylase [Photobacterium angustum]KJG02126.1 acetoacetate decarboxylase [Photobacterium angustum]KJG16813.1 acetoacetate decarboxylase [Photobacterium angustum]KJG23168.1 acetoacetate decarboxylase [Photobacterium angustum]KJG30200.1 acetoacetate decarboxylase [Photobacterium angustum]